jgi:hypothetical protein
MRRLTTALAALLLSLPLFAQRGQLVDVFGGQSQVPVTSLFFRDVSNNTEYICTATRDQPLYTWTLASKALTNIVVLTNVGTVTTAAAHGLSPGNLVTVTGATVDTDLNASYYVQTVGSTVTFTITTSGVSDATYVDAGLAISTNAPRNTAAIWDIQKFSYTTTYLDRIQSSPPRSICANRATNVGASKVTFN